MEEQEAAFKILKNALLSKLILAYPNSKHKLIVQTDTSLTALGGVLSQIGDDGHEHHITYCSRVLNKYKHNYSVTE